MKRIAVENSRQRRRDARGERTVKDAAENSQALRDSNRAGSEFNEAEAAGASPTVLAELAKIRTSADARVDSLRRRVG
jgi:hypothetical protein